MEKHEIGGKFVEKYFPEKPGDKVIEWPDSMAELANLAKSGKILIEGKEFKVDAERLCQWAYRGFSLQHQGSELLSPEEKAKRKAMRKDESATKKQAKEVGIDIASLVKAEIARRLAEKKPA